MKNTILLLLVFALPAFVLAMGVNELLKVIEAAIRLLSVA